MEKVVRVFEQNQKLRSDLEGMMIRTHLHQSLGERQTNEELRQTNANLITELNTSNHLLIARQLVSDVREVVRAYLDGNKFYSWQMWTADRERRKLRIRKNITNRKDGC